MKHTNDTEVCPACEDKLTLSHPDCGTFFRFLRANGYPDAHISCSWRGQKEQDECVKAHLSANLWPTSKHNGIDEEGQPCSEALDLYRRLPNGDAEFPIEYFHKIYLLLKSRPDFHIRWGGDWRDEGTIFAHKPHDGPHFELKRGLISANI